MDSNYIYEVIILKNSQYLSEVFALIKGSEDAIKAVKNCGNLIEEFFMNYEYLECPNMIILYAAIVKDRLKRFNEALEFCKFITEVAMKDRFDSLRDNGIYENSVTEEFKEIISNLFSVMEIEDNTLKLLNRALEDSVDD